MECKDIHDLLTPYLDGELGEEERQIVEAHLEGCRRCREALATTAGLQQDLRLAFSLEADRYSPSPQAWHGIRQYIANQEPPAATTKKRGLSLFPFRFNWKAGLAGALVVAIVVGLAATVPPLLKHENTVLAKAAAAASAELESYRVSRTTISEFLDKPEIGPTITNREDWEIVLPNSVHAIQDHYYFSTSQGVTTIVYDYSFEFYAIGENLYFQAGSRPDKIESLMNGTNIFSSSGGTPTIEYGLGILQFIFELEQLPNETLDGVECLHYSGVPRFGNIPCEIWIGKDDYFIRQIINRYEDDRLIQTFITKYYDFNEDIDIQPPVDSSGSLLSGWETESIESAFFLVPVYDAIADIDENADWSNPDVVLEALAMIGSVTEPYTYYQALPEEGQQAIMDFLKSVMAGSVGEIKITTTIISDGKTTVISDGQTTIIK